MEGKEAESADTSPEKDFDNSAFSAHYTYISCRLVKGKAHDTDAMFEVSQDPVDGRQSFQFECTAESSTEDTSHEDDFPVSERFPDWTWDPADHIDEHSASSWPLDNTHSSLYEQDFSMERPGPSRQQVLLSREKPCFSSDDLHAGVDWPLTKWELKDSCVFFGSAEVPCPEAGHNKLEQQRPSPQTYYMGIGEPGSSSVNPTKDSILVVVTPPSDPNLCEGASEGSWSHRETNDGRNHSGAPKDDVSSNSASSQSIIEDLKLLEKLKMSQASVEQLKVTNEIDNVCLQFEACRLGSIEYHYTEGDRIEANLQGNEEKKESDNEKKTEGTGNIFEDMLRNDIPDRNGDMHVKQEICQHKNIGEKRGNNKATDSQPEHTEKEKNEMGSDKAGKSDHEECLQEMAYDFPELCENNEDENYEDEEEGPSKTKFNEVLRELCNKVSPAESEPGRSIRAKASDNKNQSGLTSKGTRQRESENEPVTSPFPSPVSATIQAYSRASEWSPAKMQGVKLKSPYEPIPKPRKSLLANADGVSAAKPPVANADNVPPTRPLAVNVDCLSPTMGSNTKKMVALFSKLPTEKQAANAFSVCDLSLVSKLKKTFESPATRSRSRSEDNRPPRLFVCSASEQLAKVKSDTTELLASTDRASVPKTENVITSISSSHQTVITFSDPKFENSKSQQNTTADVTIPEPASKSQDLIKENLTSPAVCTQQITDEKKESKTAEGSANSEIQSVEAILFVLESMQAVINKMCIMEDPSRSEMGVGACGGLISPASSPPMKKKILFKAAGKKQEDDPRQGGMYVYSIAYQVVGQAVRKISELYPNCQHLRGRSSADEKGKEDSLSLSLAITAMQKVLGDLGSGRKNTSRKTKNAGVQTSDHITGLDISSAPPGEVTRGLSHHYDIAFSALCEAMTSAIPIPCSGADTSVPTPTFSREHCISTNSLGNEHICFFSDEVFRKLSFELVGTSVRKMVTAIVNKTEKSPRREKPSSTTQAGHSVSAADCNMTFELSSGDSSGEDVSRTVLGCGGLTMDYEFAQTISKEVFDLVTKIYDHLVAGREDALNITANARRVSSTSVDNPSATLAVPGCSGAACLHEPACSDRSDNKSETCQTDVEGLLATTLASAVDREKSAVDERDSPSDFLQRRQRENIAARLFTRSCPSSSSSSQAPVTNSLFDQDADRGAKLQDQQNRAPAKPTTKPKPARWKRPSTQNQERTAVRPCSSPDDTDSSIERLFNPTCSYAASLGFSEHSLSHRAVTAESSYNTPSDLSDMRTHQLDLDRHWGSPEDGNNLRLIANGGVVMHGGNQPEHVSYHHPSCSTAASSQVKQGEDKLSTLQQNLTSRSLTNNASKRKLPQNLGATAAITLPCQRTPKSSFTKGFRRLRSFSEPKLDFYSRTEALECSRPRQRLLDLPEHGNSDWSIIGYYPPRSRPIYVITNTDSTSTTDNDVDSDLYEVEFEARLQQDEIDVVLDIVANYQQLYSHGHRSKGVEPALLKNQIAGSPRPREGSDTSSGPVDDCAPQTPGSSDKRSRNSSTQTSSSATPACACREVYCRCSTSAVPQTYCHCCPSGSAPRQSECSEPQKYQDVQKNCCSIHQQSTITTNRSHASCVEYHEESSAQTARGVCPAAVEPATAASCARIEPEVRPESASVDPAAQALWQKHESTTFERQDLRRVRSSNSCRFHLRVPQATSRTEGPWIPGGWANKDAWCETCRQCRRAVSESPLELQRHNLALLQAEVSQGVREIRSAMVGMCSLMCSEHAQGEQTRRQLETLTRQLQTLTGPQHAHPSRAASSQVDPDSSIQNLLPLLNIEGEHQDLSRRAVPATGIAQQDKSWCVDDTFCTIEEDLYGASVSCPGPAWSARTLVGSNEPSTSSGYFGQHAGSVIRDTLAVPPAISAGFQFERLPPTLMKAATAADKTAAKKSSLAGRKKSCSPNAVAKTGGKGGPGKVRPSVAPQAQKSPPLKAVPQRAPVGPNATNMTGTSGAFYSVAAATSTARLECTEKAATAASSGNPRHAATTPTDCDSDERGILPTQTGQDSASKEPSPSNSNCSAISRLAVIMETGKVGDQGLQNTKREAVNSDPCSTGSESSVASQPYMTELGIMAGMAFGGAARLLNLDVHHLRTRSRFGGSNGSWTGNPFGDIQHASSASDPHQFAGLGCTDECDIHRASSNTESRRPAEQRLGDSHQRVRRSRKDHNFVTACPKPDEKCTCNTQVNCHKEEILRIETHDKNLTEGAMCLDQTVNTDTCLMNSQENNTSAFTDDRNKEVVLTALKPSFVRSKHEPENSIFTECIEKCIEDSESKTDEDLACIEKCIEDPDEDLACLLSPSSRMSDISAQVSVQSAEQDLETRLQSVEQALQSLEDQVAAFQTQCQLQYTPIPSPHACYPGAVEQGPQKTEQCPEVHEDQQQQQQQKQNGQQLQKLQGDTDKVNTDSDKEHDTDKRDESGEDEVCEHLDRIQPDAFDTLNASEKQQPHLQQQQAHKLYNVSKRSTGSQVVEDDTQLARVHVQGGTEAVLSEEIAQFEIVEDCSTVAHNLQNKIEAKICNLQDDNVHIQAADSQLSQVRHQQQLANEANCWSEVLQDSSSFKLPTAHQQIADNRLDYPLDQSKQNSPNVSEVDNTSHTSESLPTVLQQPDQDSSDCSSISEELEGDFTCNSGTPKLQNAVDNLLSVPNHPHQYSSDFESVSEEHEHLQAAEKSPGWTQLLRQPSPVTDLSCMSVGCDSGSSVGVLAASCSQEQEQWEIGEVASSLDSLKQRLQDFDSIVSSCNKQQELMDTGIFAPSFDSFEPCIGTDHEAVACSSSQKLEDSHSNSIGAAGSSHTYSQHSQNTASMIDMISCSQEQEKHQKNREDNITTSLESLSLYLREINLTATSSSCSGDQDNSSVACGADCRLEQNCRLEQKQELSMHEQPQRSVLRHPASTDSTKPFLSLEEVLITLTTELSALNCPQPGLHKIHRQNCIPFVGDTADVNQSVKPSSDMNNLVEPSFGTDSLAKRNSDTKNSMEPMFPTNTITPNLQASDTNLAPSNTKQWRQNPLYSSVTSLKSMEDRQRNQQASGYSSMTSLSSQETVQLRRQEQLQSVSCLDSLEGSQLSRQDSKYIVTNLVDTQNRRQNSPNNVASYFDTQNRRTDRTYNVSTLVSLEDILQGLRDRLAHPRIRKQLQSLSPASFVAGNLTMDEILQELQRRVATGSLHRGSSCTIAAGSVSDTTACSGRAGRIKCGDEELIQMVQRQLSGLRIECLSDSHTPASPTCNTNTNSYTATTTAAPATAGARRSERGRCAVVCTQSEGQGSGKEVDVLDVLFSIMSPSNDEGHRAERAASETKVSLHHEHLQQQQQLSESLKLYKRRVRSLERKLSTEKELHGITISTLTTMERDHTNLRDQIASMAHRRSKSDKNTRLREIMARAQLGDALGQDTSN